MRRLEPERGAVALQMAMILPILIIVAIGLFEVWRVLYLQQMLNDAAYQGVRLLATQPNREEIPEEVDKLVRRYVARSPFVDPALRDNPDSGRLLYVGTEWYPPRCGSPVIVTVQMNWRVGQGWAGTSSDSSWLPFLGLAGTLTGRADGRVLCERAEDVY